MRLLDLRKLADPKYGLRVKFVSGWETRGASGGAQMSAAAGALWHHTAGSRKGNNPSRHILIYGRKGLSGPLCHINLPRDGSVEVVAAGKANHAGKGIVRGIPRNTGNTRLVGIEMESAGTKPWDWTPAQLAAMPLLGAALSDIFGLSSSQHWGHMEYSSTGKIDPAGLPGGMAGLRSRIASVRFGGGTARPGTPASSGNPSGLADVDKSQALLASLGYDPGPIDGKFGTRTQSATELFQTDFGITPTDGRPGPATRTHLEEAVTTLNELAKKIDQLPRQVWGIGGGANAPMIGRRYEKGSEYPETTLGSMTDRIIRQQLVPLRKEVAAQSATIKALADLLAKGTDVDPAAIEAAVSAGVSKALGNLEVSVAKPA